MNCSSRWLLRVQKRSLVLFLGSGYEEVTADLRSKGAPVALPAKPHVHGAEERDGHARVSWQLGRDEIPRGRRMGAALLSYLAK